MKRQFAENLFSEAILNLYWPVFTIQTHFPTVG